MNHIDIITNLDNYKDKYLVIGVSSGPDSMALLHMIKNNTHKSIVCAHINHNVRKKSNEEETFLKDYCKKNGIIFESMKIIKYTKANFEAEAREKRYAFYKKILKKYNSHTLLLAHHGDDLIETVLMKIIRGSSILGYAGIKTYSYLKDYTIVRPLLNLTKNDILIYNKENNIEYYIDNTNEDTKYTRNRIRKNILPLLKQEDKSIHLKFLKYSNTLQEYYNYLEDVTKEKINTKYRNNKINLNLFNKEHPFIKKQIIFHILNSIYNNNDDIIKDKHIDSIINLINTNKPNISVDLPNNYIAKKEYNCLFIERKKDLTDNYKIELQDINKVDDFIIKKIEKIDTDGNDVCRLNSKNIIFPLYLRNKKDGDIVSILGTDGTKKLKDIFIDEKIPLSKRKRYPLLVDANDNILWIPGLKKTKYNVKKDEFYDIILNSYEESEEKNEKQKESK